MYKQNKVILASIITTMLLFSCNSTEPGNGGGSQEPDSTTHNIYWEADTLGDRFTYVYDVWGTDENNIWVAGWFIIDDWGTNFMHYNGTEWEQDPFFAADINGIFGFNKNEIYAVGGDLLDDDNALVAKYNGKKWEIIFVDETAPILRKIWGSSSNDLFACGLGGIIYHFDGTNWTRMESGTTERLDDIWGTAPNHVYVCGGEGYTMENIILHYDGTSWQSICEQVDSCNGIDSRAIWGSGKDNIYIETGRSNYQGNLEDGWKEINIRNENTEIRRISGSSSYNVFQVGPFGLIVHYNGRDWHRYGLYNKPHGDVFESVKVIGNHVYVVGDTETSSRGIIFKGTYY